MKNEKVKLQHKMEYTEKLRLIMHRLVFEMKPLRIIFGLKNFQLYEMQIKSNICPFIGSYNSKLPLLILFCYFSGQTTWVYEHRRKYKKISRVKKYN